MQSLTVNGFDADDVKDAISGASLGTSERRFRFELLDETNSFIRDLNDLTGPWRRQGLVGGVLGGTVYHVSGGSIKHAATLTIREANISLDDYPDLVIADGPLFYLKLGEASGASAVDSSGNARHFTYNGTPGYGSQSLLENHPENTAVLHDGSTTYESIADAAWMDVSAITLEAWIQTSATGIFQVIMSRDNFSTQQMWQLRIRDTNVVDFVFYKSTAPTVPIIYITNAIVTDGVPHHIVATYDGTNVAVYVDSVPALRATSPGTLNTGTLGIDIGRNNGGIQHLSGVGDEVAMYGRALSSIEVREHFQQGSGDLAEINYERDRIKIYCAVKMETNGTDGTPWAEAPVGVFLLSSPDRDQRKAGIDRTVTCYDQTIILEEDSIITDRAVVATGVNYITQVTTVLTSAGLDTTGYQLQPSTLTIPTVLSWPVGTSKLKIVNDLLAAINYKPFRFSMSGVGIAEENVLPEDRAVEYDYTTDSDSVVAPDMKLSLDLAAVPNKVILVRLHPKLGDLTGVATNNNFNSPVSVQRRGRTKTYQNGAVSVDAADQTTIDAMAVQVLSEQSQPSQTWRFKTALNPFHDDQDKLTVADTTGQYSFDLEGEWIEDEWIMPIDDTGLMEHVVRRVVSVS